MRKFFVAAVSLMLVVLMACPLGAFADGTLTERVVAGETTLFGNAAIFTSDGSTLTTSNVTNASASIEGTALVAKQGTGTSNGVIRIKSNTLPSKVTDKVVVEFDLSGCRSTVTLKIKWGQSWSDSSSVVICDKKVAAAGTAIKVKSILDFTNKKVTAYYDGVAQTPVDIPDAANKGTVSMFMHLEGIKVNGNLNYAKIDNFTMYKTSGNFAGENANGGAAFNLPIDETLSTAKIGGQTAELCRMAESESVINTYYADYSALNLAAGDYDVEISAVPLGGTAEDAKTVTYSVTVLEPLVLSDFALDAENGRASVSAKNNTNAAKTITMLIAEYDANGKLVNVSAEDKTVAVSEDAQSFDITLSGVSASNTLKAFIWDSLSGMKPLAEAK